MALQAWEVPDELWERLAPLIPERPRRFRYPGRLHRVVDRQAGVDGTAGAVDVKRDLLLGVGRLEMQQLGDRQVREFVIDWAAEKDDPLVEQARVDVECPLAERGLLDHHRNQRAHLWTPRRRARQLRRRKRRACFPSYESKETL